MKNFVKYGVYFLLLAMACGCTQQQSLPSLKETFSKKDKNPFGGYVFYDQVDLLFNHNVVHIEKENFETVWQNMSDTSSLYISISKNLFLTKADEKAMLSYVESGNTLFLSSQHIDSTLLDSLGCKVVAASPFTETLENIRPTSVRMDTIVYSKPGPYNYFYLPLNSYFKSYDTSITNVLGKNDAGNANFIEIYYGKGKFYLQCEPRAMSNYFLLQQKNYQYLQNIFVFINTVPQHVYWDDYYNKRNYKPNGKNAKSGIGLLLQYPQMAWAFWLLLLLLALYILFGGKRRQRIVDTIPPNTNTTVAFTETVGHLYLQKKDNKNIADKMIMYFQEHIRKQYFLNTSHVNDIFITTLSRKSNTPQADTEALFALILEVQQSAQISDVQLLSLNQHIENFYKNKL